VQRKACSQMKRYREYHVQVLVGERHKIQTFFATTATRSH